MKDGQTVFSPSSTAWIFTSAQVLAILDVDDVNSNVGAERVILTAASMNILEEIQKEDLPDLQPSPKKAKKPAHRKINFKQVFRKNARHNAKKYDCSNVDKEKEGTVRAADIRRSEAGREIIRKIVLKAAELDQLVFATSPAFDLSTEKCIMKSLSKELNLQDFIELVPAYFQYKFFNKRKGNSYGEAVYKELADILDELRMTQPGRTKWLKLIVDFNSAKLLNKIHL